MAESVERGWDDTDTSNLGMSDIGGGPFEGPEKLLELWFAPSADALVEGAGAPTACARAPAEGPRAPRRTGLRRVPRSAWEAMLELVKCKTLSVVSTADVDAYLLSESSMFVYPHKVVLKTCGTTTLLLGLERLLRIAKAALFDAPAIAAAAFAQALDADVSDAQLGACVQRCFYSRKSFMFPEKQRGPHRDWVSETRVLDRFFVRGAAYTVGKMNGDHWLLYMAAAQDGARARRVSPPAPSPVSARAPPADMTLEILMTDLAPEASAQFFFDVFSVGSSAPPDLDRALGHAHELGSDLSHRLGLATLFPHTHLDAFAFEPCGYSANALVPAPMLNTAGYWTVHVTPEQGSSYASFETNIALDCAPPPDRDGTPTSEAPPPAAPTPVAPPPAAAAPAADATPYNAHVLVDRVVRMFRPNTFTLTLFVSADAALDSSDASVFRPVQVAGYRQSDRILYEFEGYDLLFVSFRRDGA
ncbi:adenosylmethionine decarboxylase [Malassezia sp. CBS 17886]|nr:adenosylmethionine decarboxylase [Malassezia sp. CBS 17886]